MEDLALFFFISVLVVSFMNISRLSCFPILITNVGLSTTLSLKSFKVVSFYVGRRRCCTHFSRGEKVPWMEGGYYFNRGWKDVGDIGVILANKIIVL